MKAILEIPVPESCAVCFLGEGERGYNSKRIRCSARYYMDTLSESWRQRNESWTYFGDERAPFCPLRIVPDVVAVAIGGYIGTEEENYGTINNSK